MVTINAYINDASLECLDTYHRNYYSQSMYDYNLLQKHIIYRIFMACYYMFGVANIRNYPTMMENIANTKQQR